MFGALRSEENLMEEVKYIIKETCSKESDPNECTMLVKQYWPIVAKALFVAQNSKYVCEGLDPACSSFPHTLRWEFQCHILFSFNISNLIFSNSQGLWNCDKCKADVAAVGTLLVSDDAANFAVDRLQGIDFCQDPGFGLKGDDIKTCQMYVGKYIPPIMKHLFNGMGDGAEMICAKLYNQCK